jgi:hypothetical protein
MTIQTDQHTPHWTIIRVTPTHIDSHGCYLCGDYLEDVDAYTMWDAMAYETIEAIADVFDRHKIGGTSDDRHALAYDLTNAVDPLAQDGRHGDEEIVCTTCVHATRRELRKRITEHANHLENAGWADYHGDGNEDLADPTLRDQGRWLRRYIGWEIAIEDQPPPSPAAGTSLRGYIHTSYDQLVAEFGQPGPPVDDVKSRVEWYIDTPHGIATIYDYQELDTTTEQITEWHIGGHNHQTAQWIADRLGRGLTHRR